MIYSDKDYASECVYLQKIFSKYSSIPIKSLLDIGCGTGNYLLRLAKAGYNVTGIDGSKEMLRVAELKAKRESILVKLEKADMRNFDLQNKYDACICMFAVLGYSDTIKGVKTTLSHIREHLKPHGLFVFDVWYGPAVNKIRPSARLKIIRKQGLRILRFATPNLLESDHVCEVGYHLLVSRSNRIIFETDEKHVMRYFYLQELREMLNASGLHLIKALPFLSFKGKPSSNTWNVLCVCNAI